ncbi:MAG TPA: DUF2167 domain-containing protein [Gemmatimonadales bacterium]|nr:DUF2167 domain-containing protein [Gemmatimonadales bacterium]
MRTTVCRWALAVLAGFSVAPHLAAQEADESDLRRRFRSIAWEDGPAAGALGREAEVQVPEGCRFTGAAGTKTFMELNENPTSGDERGTILCRGPEDSGSWFVVLTYRGSGYVKDDERGEIEADKLLATIRKGNSAGNAERRKRGWETLEIDGWQRPPYYDQRTNNLTWGLRIIGASGDTTINHSVRLLGRGGVMEVDLVAGPAMTEAAMPAFETILEGFAYVPGQRYAEWRAGDKVAEYGLTALIAGGAGAAAVKSGILGKLGKAIIAVVVAAVAGLKSLAGRIFGKKSPRTA